MSEFFIKRPVFAWVLVIITVIAGALSLVNMPIEQYPNVAPPVVSISASLSGASADVLENSVTQIIEQSLIGIDRVRYFSSTSDSDGNVNLSIIFEPGTNPDVAQMQVQNKLQTAMPLLPKEVQEQGINVNKSNSNFLIVAVLYSEDDSLSDYDLADILLSDVKDRAARINGVGNISIFGSPHAMRIWLDPFKLFFYKISVTEVMNAIKNQNVDISAGQIGGAPSVKGQEINATIRAKSRLRTVKDFENIWLKVNTDGSKITLKDVAKVELGSQSYSVIARYKKHPAAGMVITPASGSNVIKTSAEVKKVLSELESSLPRGVKVVFPYDAAPFIKISIKNVVKTLIEAIILVFVVMFIFLQNFRATLIPFIAVPVVLLGTFLALYFFGFTINTLTMFAMVLSIGLLVDDAIVVVENVERIMSTENLTALQATQKSMKEISGALVGVAAVLSAVFVPMAFFSGSSGAIYKQFSVTIVFSMIFSVLVALILSPCLCAGILKNTHNKKNIVFEGFNRLIKNTTSFYSTWADFIIKRWLIFIFVYLGVIVAFLFLFTKLPRSFLPTEDQGALYVTLKAPNGSSLERTSASVMQVEDYFLSKEADVDHFFAVVGFSAAGRAQNAGFAVARLKDWKFRKRPDQSVMTLSERASKNLNNLSDARVFTYFPPPIRELGNVAGFEVNVLNSGNLNHNDFMDLCRKIVEIASKNPILTGVRHNGFEDVPQLKLDIDYEKAMSLGLLPADINQTLQTAWGSTYVNNFIDKERIKRVYLQGEAVYRRLPEDISKWYVKNNKGDMVSFSSFTSRKWVYGSPKLERFNGVPSYAIQGSATRGFSSEDAMTEIENIIKQVSSDVSYAWTGISYDEKNSQSSIGLLYGLSIIAVFLCLAALYESWSIPISVILVLPFGFLGAVLSTLLCKMNNDIYFQIGLLTTVGLSAKNAILVIEFAQKLYQSGMDLKQAALTALKIRFRPIVMTSMAFLLGILPLVFATGAGSESQNAIGVGVLGGVFAATFIALCFIPMFYVIVKRR